MVDACSSPGFMVLREELVVHLPGNAPGQGWVSVECASKEAYGCGVLGDKLLEGLTLYVRRLGRSDDLNSTLSICLSDLALRSIQAELCVPAEFRGIKGCLPEVDGAIKMVNQKVLVLMVIFRRRNHSKRVYYLVYDAKDASLYMIPYIPEGLEATFTLTPVPAGGQGHELALMARKFWPQRAERGRLCVCTPWTRAANPSTGPWAMKVHRFPNLPQAFSADVMFSLEDKVFWADLSQGVAYTDLRKGGSVLDAVFIKLPHGYQIDFSALPTHVQIEPANVSRAMGCVKGSIKFVCIDRGMKCCHGNEIVRVWSLDLDHQQWKEEEEGFPCLWKDLWKQTTWHKNAKLRMEEAIEPPQYPSLMSDGALCLLLPDKHLRRKGVDEAGYICSFDMISKSCLWFGHVHSYQSIGPVILPYSFFKDFLPCFRGEEFTNTQEEAYHQAGADAQACICSVRVGLKSKEQAESCQDNYCTFSPGSEL